MLFLDVLGQVGPEVRKLERHQETELETRHEGEGDQEEVDQTDSCLLYTSPSPRDATLSRMPSSA